MNDRRFSKVPLKLTLSSISKGRTPEYASGGQPVVTQGSVQRGVLDLSNAPYTDEPASALFLSYPGDVLINTLGTGTVGRSCLNDHGVLAIDSNVLVLRPNTENDGRFIGYLVQSKKVQEQLEQVLPVGATNQVSLRPEVVGHLRVGVPSHAVQHSVADFLDAETARIDALIDKKRHMMELLKERWRSATATRMDQLAEARGTIQLRHLIRCLDGRRVPLSSEERSHRQGDYPYYGASEVVDHIDDFLFDETLVLLGEDGAQLGDPSYPIARVAQGKFWVNNHAHVLRPVNADPDFLVLHLNTFDRVPYMSGGTREKITQDDMSRIAIPWLSVDDQRAEAEVLVGHRRDCDEASRLISRQVGLLVERRQVLITAAVTGELLVPGAAV